MKKIVLLLLVFFVAVGLSGCMPYMFNPLSCLYGVQEETSSNYFDEETTIWEEETETTEENMSNPILSGMYTCYNTEYYAEGYFPYVELYEDGSFFYYVNLGDGMGSVWGTYVVDGNYVDLYVDEMDFSGYYGDDVSIVSFFIINENTLELFDGEIGLTFSGSYFEK